MVGTELDWEKRSRHRADYGFWHLSLAVVGARLLAAPAKHRSPSSTGGAAARHPHRGEKWIMPSYTFYPRYGFVLRGAKAFLWMFACINIDRSRSKRQGRAGPFQRGCGLRNGQSIMALGESGITTLWVACSGRMSIASGVHKSINMITF